MTAEESQVWCELIRTTGMCVMAALVAVCIWLVEKPRDGK